MATPQDVGAFYDSIRDGRLDQIRGMIGQNPSLLDEKLPTGLTPLMEATRCAKTTLIIELLMDKKAEKDGHEELLAYMNTRDQKGWGATHYGAALMDDYAIKTLVKRGASIESTNLDGNTPIVIAISASSLFVVRYLYEQGCRTDITVEPDKISLIDWAIYWQEQRKKSANVFADQVLTYLKQVVGLTASN